MPLTLATVHQWMRLYHQQNDETSAEKIVELFKQLRHSMYTHAHFTDIQTLIPALVNLSPNDETYVLVTSALMTLGPTGIERADVLLEKQRVRHMTPSTSQLNTLLAGFIQHRQYDRAWMLFGDMMQERRADILSYGIMLQAAGQVGHKFASCHRKLVDTEM